MPTVASDAQIRREFDSIAQLTPETEGLGPLDGWLLANLPPRREAALEIGCGVGNMSRRLSRTFSSVVGIDFSPAMIEEAKRRTHSEANVAFNCVDMFEWLREHPNEYDCIVTVATLHHVDFALALGEMAHSLKPGGRLLVIDLYNRTGWRNIIVNGFAYAFGIARRLWTFRGIKSWKLWVAFRRHGKNETYLTLSEVKRITAQELPGAQLNFHVLWRYGVLWDSSQLRVQ
jgi:2-polyprenyl-3-methyl-5-hydroxy-6-metoxy-1,4-benzoquinol methylase